MKEKLKKISNENIPKYIEYFIHYQNDDLMLLSSCQYFSICIVKNLNLICQKLKFGLQLKLR